MNILIDINHPAHVHLFKKIYYALVKNNHNVTVVVKNIPSAIALLQLYEIPYINIGQKNDSIFFKAFDQFIYDYKILKIAINNKIDIGVGSSINIAHVSCLCKMKSIILDDDDDKVEPLFVKFAHPFADVILSPVGTPRKSKKVIFVNTYHELSYLHPNEFVPNTSVLYESKINQDKPYFVLRFNAFKAHHDFGVEGLSIEHKRRLIKDLLQYGQVFITTERNIDDEFKQYQLKISQDKIHSLIYYSTMLVGDSQTMTSEAAVLGTPAIRCNSFVGNIHYLEEEEHKYELTYGFLPSQAEEMFDKINNLLQNDKLKEIWSERRQKMLSEKIDYAKFLTWFIENYPESVKIIKANPDYQYTFR